MNPGSAIDNAAALQKQYLQIRDGGSHLNLATSVISTHEYRRKRGEPMIKESIIFHEGMVYTIQEEIFSDDDHSSVYTAEDSFEEDDHLPVKLKQEMNQLRNIGTPGTDLNSIQSSHFAGFVEHKENIKRMLSKVAGLGPTRPES